MTRYNVGVVKLPHADRTLERDILGERPGEKFRNIIGADTADDDPRFPVGSNCTYNAELTDDDVGRLRAAPHVRYVSEDVVIRNVAHAGNSIPAWNTWNFMGDWAAGSTLNGQGVNVAIMDMGTSSAARAYKNLTLVARSNFTAAAPAAGAELYSGAGTDHGCLSMGVGVPYSGRIIDAQCIDGNNATTDSYTASAITWVVGQGAKVVNGSFGFGTTTAPASHDAMAAASSSDVVFYWSAGNDGLNQLDYPAYYSTQISWVYSVAAWDVSIGHLWSSSNWNTGITGVAPGVWVATCDDPTYVPTYETFFYGTSASSPHVANACARLVSGGVTARAAGAALAATTVDLGQAPYQSRGAFSIRRAAEYLGISPPAVQPADPVVFQSQKWVSYL